MNHIHSIVWSECRKSFIVVGEGAKAKGKPCSSTRNTVASAVVMALSALAAGPAMAVGSSCPAASIGISGAETVQCTLASGNALTVNAGGSIITGGATYAVLIGNAVTSTSITNSGTISGGGGIFATSGALNSSLVNNGTIRGTNGNAIWLTKSNLTGGIVNSAGGTITSSNMGIQLHKSTVSGDINNSGTINASARAIQINAVAAGGGITGSTIGGIVNSGTITGGSSGINIATHSTVTGSITNSGLISGVTGVGLYFWGSMANGGITNSGTISGGSRGLVVFRTSTVNGGITNNGLITSSGIGSNGIRIRIASTVNDGITNTGTISAQTGIYLGNTSTINGSISNSGTISGSTKAIYVDGTSSLDSIVIAGNNTAKFIGQVDAVNTPVTVASGATYTMDNGNLFTVQRFTNAGTLNVGAGSTGTIAGSFTNSGTFSPSVASNAGYGKLTTSGTASLGGTLFVNAPSATSLQTGTLVGAITASAVSGTFSSYSDNSLLYDFIPVYNGSSVDLKLQAATAAALNIAISTGSTGAIGTATALDQIFTDHANPITSLFVPVYAQGTTAMSNAINETVPLLTGGQAQATSDALHGVNKIVQAHQEGQLGRSTGDEFFGDKHFWMKPFGSWANQSDRKGVSGYSADTYGLVFGADAEISDTNRVGVALAYSNSNVDGNSTVARQNSDVDSYQLVAYGSHSFSAATDLNAQIDIGRHNTTGNRVIAFTNSVAHADYSSWSAHIGVGGAHTFPINEKTSITPSVRADYSLIRDESYNETGAGVLNLNVNSHTAHELILGVDGKLTHQLTDKATVTANLGIGYDVLNEQASITAAFAGAPTTAFTTKGLDPSPWLARGGLGLVGKVSETVEVTGRYDFEVRQSFDNQTASVKVRWAF